MASPGLINTPGLRPYVATRAPVIAGNDERYIREEFRKIQDAIGQIITACKALEQRIVNSGF